MTLITLEQTLDSQGADSVSYKVLIDGCRDHEFLSRFKKEKCLLLAVSQGNGDYNNVQLLDTAPTGRASRRLHDLAWFYGWFTGGQYKASFEDRTNYLKMKESSEKAVVPEISKWISLLRDVRVDPRGVVKEGMDLYDTAKLVSGCYSDENNPIFCNRNLEIELGLDVMHEFPELVQFGVKTQLRADDTLLSLLVLASEKDKRQRFAFKAQNRDLQRIFYDMKTWDQDKNKLLDCFKYSEVPPHCPVLDKARSNLQLAGLVVGESPNYDVIVLSPAAKKYFEDQLKPKLTKEQFSGLAALSDSFYKHLRHDVLVH